MIALPCDSTISGIQGLLGHHYCINPLLWYLVGCGSIGGYLGATMTCIMLAVDRFFEILFPKTATILFGGTRIYLWMLVPIAYTIFTLTQIPAFYSIKYQAFYYDPYIGTPGFEGNPYVTFKI
uniref:Cytochrome-c oxidase n=1 Tax=Acrobeloides nanus TaxID=290746 RepID=A0A914DZY7_9BILA